MALSQSLDPAFDLIRSVFCFPALQDLVITTFGLDYFTAVRVLVCFDQTSTALRLALLNRSATSPKLRVENVDQAS